MAQALRVRRSFLALILPLLTAGACSTCPPGAFDRPSLTRGGLLALSSDYYTVRAEPGDTYMGLAWEHNVSPYAVISLNEVKAPYYLKPGELVRIPTPRIHVVRRGETLSEIANAYHVDFYDLAQVNALYSPYTIFPGQVLALPVTGPSFKSPRKNRSHAFSRPLDPPEPRTAPQEREAPRPIPRKEQPNVPEEFAELPRPRPRPAETIPASALPRPKPRAVTAQSAEGPEPAETVAEPLNAANELIWPVKGRIISGFGPTPNGRRNDGINIAVPEGTPVRAAADGVVIYCGNEVAGFGNLILIQHAGDIVTAYAHASEIKVEKGALVRKGQPIALSGRTGNVEEPQLHFEVRRGVKAVDPVEHLST